MTQFTNMTLNEAWRARGYQPLRALLAEDDADLRALIILDLQQVGVQVTAVSDGSEALDRFRESLEGGRIYDVIISDFKMPRLSGLKLLAAVRAECDVLPFILMTAFADLQMQSEARRLGASTILEKPFDLEALNLALRRVG